MTSTAYVFGGDDIEVRHGSTPRLVAVGTVIEVFEDEAGLSPVPSLFEEDGDPISSLEVDADSKIPRFTTGVLGQSILWVRINNGPLSPITARLLERVEALELSIGAGGLEYVHTQPVDSPASIWTCTTGLVNPRDPMIFLDEDPQVPVWADVRYLGSGIIQIDFGIPKTGRAYF